MQRQIGDWLATGSYLGNHSSHLWRATELNPAVFGPGATTGNTNQRRVLYLANPAQGQFYGTIGQLDDTGRANYNALLLSLQRRLKNNLSVLSNWTISKCMSDPATTEITGPTIVNPANPDLDYWYCAVGSPPRREPVARRPHAGLPGQQHPARDLQRLAGRRRSSGGRAATASSVTTGVDNALTGLGGQRAVQILDRSVRQRRAAQYLNRAAFTTPATGIYSDLPPFTIVNPPNFQNDFALTRTFRIGRPQNIQFRWEVFNVINHVNFNAPVASLNSASFGQIQSTRERRRSAYHAVRVEVHLLRKIASTARYESTKPRNTKRV